MGQGHYGYFSCETRFISLRLRMISPLVCHDQASATMASPLSCGANLACVVFRPWSGPVSGPDSVSVFPQGSPAFLPLGDTPLSILTLHGRASISRHTSTHRQGKQLPAPSPTGDEIFFIIINDNLFQTSLIAHRGYLPEALLDSIHALLLNFNFTTKFHDFFFACLRVCVGP